MPTYEHVGGIPQNNISELPFVEPSRATNYSRLSRTGETACDVSSRTFLDVCSKEMRLISIYTVIRKAHPKHGRSTVVRHDPIGIRTSARQHSVDSSGMNSIWREGELLACDPEVLLKHLTQEYHSCAIIDLRFSKPNLINGLLFYINTDRRVMDKYPHHTENVSTAN